MGWIRHTLSSRRAVSREKCASMQVWPLWTIAAWLNRVEHKSRKGGYGRQFLAGPPGGLAATRRSDRGKRLVFVFYGHHHHVCKLLIFLVFENQ